MRMKVTSLPQDGCAFQSDGNGFLQADLRAPVHALRLRPDMAVCFWECTTTKTQRYHLEFDCPVLRFSFVLEGEGISHAEGQEDFTRHKGLIEMRYFPKFSGEITLAANHSHKWLDIILLPSFLEVALPDETPHLPHTLNKVVTQEAEQIPCESRRMTPEQFVAATQLSHCPYTHAARTLYLKSKTLELLSHVLAEQAPVPCQTKLSTYEAGCLKKARELLIANLENPPSLKTLALQVGLNETKLKSGFKTLFGQTVFGYFRTYRVEVARQRLLESNDSVSEIASRVGYTNISHFSAAFKERHGVTPSRYRKDNVFFANTPEK